MKVGNLYYIGIFIRELLVRVICDLLGNFSCAICCLNWVPCLVRSAVPWRMGEELGGIAGIPAWQPRGVLALLVSELGSADGEEWGAWSSGMFCLFFRPLLISIRDLCCAMRLLLINNYLAIDNGKLTNYNPNAFFHRRGFHVSQKQRSGGTAALPLLLLCVVTSVLGPAVFSRFLSNLNTWTDESLHLRIPPEAVSFCCCDTSFFSPPSPPLADLHGQRRNPSRLCKQPCDAALPEVWI